MGDTINNNNTEQRESEQILLLNQENDWQTRRRKKKEQIERARREEGERQGDDFFPMYYTLRFPGTDIDTCLPPFTSCRQILQEAGGELEIEQMGRYTLLLKTKSRQQGENILKITEIAGKRVEAKEHQSLNYSKGTVHSRAFGTELIQTIKDDLRSQGVVEVERMKTKRNGVVIGTDRYILTFNQPRPPRVIRCNLWTEELVELYIPQPMRCIRCWRYGHTQAHCRRQIPVCSRCAEEGHFRVNCNKPFRCVNCGGEHECTVKNCPAFVFKSEVIKYQTRERCGYPEAETKVREEFAASGKAHTFTRWRQTDPPSQGPNDNTPRTSPEEELRTQSPERGSDPSKSIAQSLRLIRLTHPTPDGAITKKPPNHSGALPKTTSGGQRKGNGRKSEQEAGTSTNPHQSAGAGNSKGSERDPRKLKQINNKHHDTIAKFLNKNQKTGARRQERKSPTKTSDRPRTANPENKSQQTPQKLKKQSAGTDIPKTKGTGKKSPPILGDQKDTSDIPPKPPDPNNKPHPKGDSSRGDKASASIKTPVMKIQITETESESSGNEQAPEAGALRQGQWTANRFHVLSEASNDLWDRSSVNDMVKKFEPPKTPCETKDGEKAELEDDGEPGKGQANLLPEQGQEREKKRKRRSADPNIDIKKQRQNVSSEKKTMQIPVLCNHRPDKDEVTKK